VTQYNSPDQGYYNSRCLAYDELGNTFVQVQTWFDATGYYLDSVGIIEISNTTPPALTGRRMIFSPGWNIRGIEFDPRDGDYWVTIPQLDYVYVNDVVKIRGFYRPIVGTEESADRSASGQLRLAVIPNPATKSAQFQVSAAGEKTINLKIYDITGRIVKNIALEQNTITVNWNRLDDNKNAVPDGVYFVRLETEDGVATEKLILTR
jgi:hypothetical protein